MSPARRDDTASAGQERVCSGRDKPASVFSAIACSCSLGGSISVAGTESVSFGVEYSAEPSRAAAPKGAPNRKTYASEL